MTIKGQTVTRTGTLAYTFSKQNNEWKIDAQAWAVRHWLDACNTCRLQCPAAQPTKPCRRDLNGAAMRQPSLKDAPAQNVYVTDLQSDRVKEIPPGCISADCVVNIARKIKCPTAVSVDSSNDLYVSRTCDFNTAIYRLAPGCKTHRCASIVPGYYLNPFGTASNAKGDLLVADYSHGYVDKVPAACQSPSCVVTLGGDAFVRSVHSVGLRAERCRPRQEWKRLRCFRLLRFRNGAGV